MGHADYMNKAFTDRFGIVTDADKILANVEFDTFVGIGVSGTLVAPLLADMGKGDHGFAIVRKEDSSHSSYKIEGALHSGDRFVFVDDLIDSGSTLEYVLEQIAREFRRFGPAFGPRMVGAYLYQRAEFLTIPELITRVEMRMWNVNEELIAMLKKLL